MYLKRITLLLNNNHRFRKMKVIFSKATFLSLGNHGRKIGALKIMWSDSIPQETGVLENANRGGHGDLRCCGVDVFLMR